MSVSYNRDMNKILIVEDEENLGITLQEYLENIGYDAYLAQSVQQAQEIFNSVEPLVVLMDIGLPDGSGLDLARWMRKKKDTFLLFFLSALNDPDTKVEGLEIGAEDYITKPFALKELTLRLERSFQLKKQMLELPDELSHGKLKIWFSKFQVQDAAGEIIHLGQKECAILELLYQSKGKAFTRDEIIDRVWGEDKYPSHRTVDNYIVKLRKWCETDSTTPLEIQSIRGIGYQLNIKND